MQSLELSHLMHTLLKIADQVIAGDAALFDTYYYIMV